MRSGGNLNLEKGIKSAEMINIWEKERLFS